jgi:hypothetical protein
VEARDRVLADPRASDAALYAVAEMLDRNDLDHRQRLLDHPGIRRSYRVPALLLRKFAVFSTIRGNPEVVRMNARARALLLQRLDDPALDSGALMEIASLIGVTDNTTVMMRMLDNPRVRACEGILEQFVITQRTYSNPASKPVPAPEEVERRANALLARLRSQGGRSDCRPGQATPPVVWN